MLDREIDRLLGILESWKGTRYASGQRTKGVSADCVGFALSAVDEFYGWQRACDPLLPSDAAFHNPLAARKAVAAIRRLYNPAERLRPAGGYTDLQPLDILVVGTSAGGPGHLMLVGPRRNTLWHCSNTAGACQTGWSLGDGYERLHAAYRCLGGVAR